MKLTRARVLTISSLAVVVTGALVVSIATPAVAATPVIGVDYTASVRAASPVGQGFLYGLAQNGNGAANTYLDPLKPTLLRGGGARIAGQGWSGDGYQAGAGYQARIQSAIAQARVANAYGAQFDLMFNDLWGVDTTQPSDTVYPCDNSDCSNWTTFVTRVVNDIRAAGVSVNFEPWNEPDNYPFWPRGFATTQYFAMWDTAYNTVRSIVPSARLTGPTVFIPNSSNIDAFLTHVKAAGTVPNILDTHNLVDEDPIAVGQMLTSQLASHSITGVQTSITEYLSGDELNAGGTAWYLSRLQRSGINLASRGVYPQQYAGQSPCCMADDLGGILVPTASGLQPSGQYWVYRTLASMKGSFVGFTGSAPIDGLASYDSSVHRSVVMVGANPGGGTAGYAGAITLNLTHIPAALSSGGVRVQVSRIPDRAVLPSPVVVSDQVVTPSSGSATVALSITDPSEALAVTLTPASASSTTTAIDSSATSGTNHFTFGNTWKTPAGISDLYAGTATTQVTPSSPSTMSFTFTGTGVTIYGVRDVDQGLSTFSLDGGTAVTADDYAAYRDSQSVLYATDGLASGQHMVTIGAPATKNAASSNTIVAIDKADVRTGTLTNPVANAGFESGLASWTSTGTSGSSYTEGTVGSTAAYAGASRLTHYAAGAFTAETTQAVNVPNGTYSVTAWAISGGPHSASYLEAKGFGGTIRTTNLTSGGQWQQLKITGIVVTNGTLTVGIYDNASGGSWTSLDEVRIVRDY